MHCENKKSPFDSYSLSFWIQGTRYKLTYDGMWHLDIPKVRQYDHGKVEIVARNSVGENRVETVLNVESRHDDYRGVLKNSPRREFFIILRLIRKCSHKKVIILVSCFIRIYTIRVERILRLVLRFTLYLLISPPLSILSILFSFSYSRQIEDSIRCLCTLRLDIISGVCAYQRYTRKFFSSIIPHLILYQNTSACDPLLYPGSIIHCFLL